MKKTLLTFFFVLTYQLVSAQFFLAGGHLNASTSMGELRDQVGGFGFPSLSGLMLYEFERAPIQVGFELGYGVYGTQLEKRRDLFPGSNEELRLRRNNNLISGMVVMRYLPLLNTKYTPFIEMQFGGNYLYTRYKIRATIDEEAFEVGTDHSDWTIAYRVGAGVQIPLSEDHIKLELRASYQNSNDIRFLTRGDVTYLPDEGIFDYDFQRGPLQFVTFSVGVVVYDIFY